MLIIRLSHYTKIGFGATCLLASLSYRSTKTGEPLLIAELFPHPT
jgi:hypothetical protein